MSNPALSDEELVAYLDDELDEARRRAVDEVLSRDERERQRLEALVVDTAAIRAAFDDLARQAPPPPSCAATPVRPQRYRRFGPVGSALIGAAMAASVALLAWPGQRDGWQDYVASYQALYIDQTLAHLSPAPADQEVELQRVAEAIGRDLPLAALTGEEALDYKRAQILGFEGQPLVQMAFLAEGDTPLALCIIRQEDEAGEAVAVTRMEGLSTATWSKGGYAYMLIGGTDDALVEAAARRFAVTL